MPKLVKYGDKIVWDYSVPELERAAEERAAREAAAKKKGAKPATSESEES